MTLLEEIKNTVKVDQPFMIEDVVSKRFSYETVKSMLSKYTKSGDIKRYCQGVYYLSERNIFGESGPTINDVLRRKYISNKKEVYGYYSGLNLLNDVGLTYQVPAVAEITSSKETTRKKHFRINGWRVITRSSSVEINKNNYKYLQFLDIFRYASEEQINKNRSNVIEYFKNNNMNVEELKKVEKKVCKLTIRKFRKVINYDELA
ncbi:MAG: hypothetical protein KBT35_02775 [Firmicutes bacterium]|nr:hypothetical protein [Candidatus Colivicinus equi]